MATKPTKSTAVAVANKGDIAVPFDVKAMIAAQIAAFVAQSHILTASTREVEIGLNVGSVEPLLV